MPTPSPVLSQQTLSSEDLDLLQTFLEAWCLENSVDMKSEAAIEVAIGLIDWYQSGMTDRSQLKAMIAENPPLPASLQTLIEQLADS